MIEIPPPPIQKILGAQLTHSPKRLEQLNRIEGEWIAERSSLLTKELFTSTANIINLHYADVLESRPLDDDDEGSGDGGAWW